MHRCPDCNTTLILDEKPLYKSPITDGYTCPGCCTYTHKLKQGKNALTRDQIDKEHFRLTIAAKKWNRSEEWISYMFSTIFEEFEE